ncbi:hypothetical protein Tco_1548503 [Tanacetum coccineum]
METHEPLLKDADGEDVDEHIYRSMIGSLMYLTSSRPYIMFVVCVCAHDGFSKVTLKLSHLYAVKRIFRYLKGQPKLGLWYPKHLPFDLVAYIDSDYAGASLDRKSTTRVLSPRYSNEKKLIQMIKIHTDKNVADLLTKALDFWATAKVKTVNGEVQLHALVDRKKRNQERPEIPQSSGPIEPIADEAATKENIPTQSNDPPLLRVNTLGSGEDRLTLKDLMDLCTKLSNRVLDLETTKTAQAKEIARSAQVVSFEDEGLGDQEDASKQGMKIDYID